MHVLEVVLTIQPVWLARETLAAFPMGVYMSDEGVGGLWPLGDDRYTQDPSRDRLQYALENSGLEDEIAETTRHGWVGHEKMRVSAVRHEGAEKELCCGSTQQRSDGSHVRVSRAMSARTGGYLPALSSSLPLTQAASCLTCLSSQMNAFPAARMDQGPQDPFEEVPTEQQAGQRASGTSKQRKCLSTRSPGVGILLEVALTIQPVWLNG
ncbi:hypothetical protein K438DRAFT_2129463 [Mycena galopus ATCC 62051]|nr:hypothetical protein K438DRAFT_2129463 [Mycena galopus ATCC 62051]